MPELYIFIGAAIAIFCIVFRRHWILAYLRQAEFKKMVASKVDEIRREETLAAVIRFKDRFTAERLGKKTDIGRYKDILRKADMALAKNQWKPAKLFLIQAMALSGDEWEPALKLAKAYFQSDDLRKAESLFDRLAELRPRHAELYEYLAKIYSGRKRYKDAISAYVKAVELDDKNDGALLALGKLYALLMRPSLAAECFRRAAELKPRETGYLFLLADACHQAEDFDNALFTYEKILTLEPYNEKAQHAAQEVRMKMKETEVLFKKQTPKPMVKTA